MKKIKEILVIAFGLLLMFSLVFADTIKDVIIKPETLAQLSELSATTGKSVSQISGEQLDSIAYANTHAIASQRFNKALYYIQPSAERMELTLAYWQSQGWIE